MTTSTFMYQLEHDDDAVSATSTTSTIPTYTVGIDVIDISVGGLVRTAKWYDRDRHLLPKLPAHRHRSTHSPQ